MSLKADVVVSFYTYHYVFIHLLLVKILSLKTTFEIRCQVILFHSFQLTFCASSKTAFSTLEFCLTI